MAKDKSSNKNMVIMELLFYAALPYVIWKFGREPLGDYVAMLLSTIPGFIYTIYRFIKDKQFNVTGVFILASLLLSTTVDLLSGSAEQMIWNGVYLGLFFTMLYYELHAYGCIDKKSYTELWIFPKEKGC